jgi:hypothetical protein
MTAMFRQAPAAGKSGWRILPRRQQARQKIEQDHQWPGDQRRGDERQPHDGWIDPAVVGDPGGDAHELGVAPVDQETSVHVCFLRFGWFKRSAAK